jgi:hypothetical protein
MNRRYTDKEFYRRLSLECDPGLKPLNLSVQQHQIKHLIAKPEMQFNIYTHFIRSLHPLSDKHLKKKGDLKRMYSPQ